MNRYRCRVVGSLCVGVVLASGAFAQATLKSHRIGGKSYVTVGDVAGFYHLGRAIRERNQRITYRTATASLVVEANSREIQLDGVGHWLSTPVLTARGEFWLTTSDILKTIDPVLRHGGVRAAPATLTILVDPGHGGRDEGTHGAHTREKDMTLDVATRVLHYLSGVTGLHTLMTRASDVTTPLEQRVELCQSDHADLYVSIHFNSGGVADGIETYCVPPAGEPTTAHAPYEGERESASEVAAVTNNRFDALNVWLAHCIQQSLLLATHANDRGVRRARFYVLRNAPCPAVLVEAGFLSNRAEEAKILTPEYREALARAIADGILVYAGKTTEGRQP
ncbi:MAG TPA: N-acetylmuramoyl-L-alanine amidase [Verrucomicrobiae bacterium]|nr:N-acetylmuramoyl-L-alanine amidase [Verrucomicrobiae bacterium]